MEIEAVVELIRKPGFIDDYRKLRELLRSIYALGKERNPNFVPQQRRHGIIAFNDGSVVTI